MKNILAALLLTTGLQSFAQTDDPKKTLTLSGYLETYYLYDFGNPSNHVRPGFVYAFNRHNEVNLNIGFVKAAYETENVRGNLSLMTGSYANANLAAEPGVLKNIYEANIGVKLSKSKNLWVDVGIMPSHIGFESAVGSVCWNLTRSILADNSPYFESGAKVSFTTEDEKWFISGLILNGWQRIQRVDGNNTPAFGHRLTYKPNDKVTLNSSSFVGNDFPDDERKMRYFHNFYGQFQLSPKLGVITGFDIGTQQKAIRSPDYDVWYSPIVITQYAVSKKVKIAARGEYYSDKNQVIVAGSDEYGFQTLGYSVNMDYNITENALWRIEARGFNSKDRIFTLNDTPTTNNYLVATSLALTF